MFENIDDERTRNACLYYKLAHESSVQVSLIPNIIVWAFTICIVVFKQSVVFQSCFAALNRPTLQVERSSLLPLLQLVAY